MTNTPAYFFDTDGMAKNKLVLLSKSRKLTPRVVLISGVAPASFKKYFTSLYNKRVVATSKASLILKKYIFLRKDFVVAIRNVQSEYKFS